jgi:hypothetical protein
LGQNAPILKTLTCTCWQRLSLKGLSDDFPYISRWRLARI